MQKRGESSRSIAFRLASLHGMLSNKAAPQHTPRLGLLSLASAGGGGGYVGPIRAKSSRGASRGTATSAGTRCGIILFSSRDLDVISMHATCFNHIVAFSLLALLQHGVLVLVVVLLISPHFPLSVAYLSFSSTPTAGSKIPHVQIKTHPCDFSTTTLKQRLGKTTAPRLGAYILSSSSALLLPCAYAAKATRQNQSFIYSAMPHYVKAECQVTCIAERRRMKAGHDRRILWSSSASAPTPASASASSASASASVRASSHTFLRHTVQSWLVLLSTSKAGTIATFLIINPNARKHTRIREHKIGPARLEFV
ncbi:hypothetical protein BP6252_13411 [Coleophoma cylindrospora]|uniref:Uncharacterized protein n=1 Tax=Coleophoma cylindrospora TaxID=1849047 RepID=A0A3D8Q8K1_9HELO|nr:hypothetical protein BP6252_13411 [Coleophoma cylindrospora]